MKPLKWGDDLTIINIIIDRDLVTVYTVDGQIYVYNLNDAGMAESTRYNSVLLEKSKGKPVKWVWQSGSAGVPTDTYTDFSTQTNGLVKFFRMAKSAVKKFFHLENKKVTVEDTAFAVPEKVAEEIKEKAQPIKKKELYDNNQETVVGLIDGIAIPNMEKIRPYFERAIKRNNPDGVMNLLKRLTKVIGERRHSVIDVLTFLEKSDLPITKDGRIMAYKRVQSKDGDYVDSYSKLVKQNVGYIVQVPDEKVDLSRNAECSAGLHVARRNYIRQFYGDTIMLILVNPEDIMVVPHGDPDKVRCRRYEIVHKLNAEGFKAITSNIALNDRESIAAVRNILAGEIKAPTDICTITGDEGKGLVYTKVHDAPKEEPKADLVPSKKPITEEDAKPIDFTENAPKRVEPRKTSLKEIQKLTKKKAPAKKKPKSSKPSTSKAAPTPSASSGDQAWRKTIIINQGIPDPDIVKALEKVRDSELSLTAIALSMNISRRTLGRWIDTHSKQP